MLGEVPPCRLLSGSQTLLSLELWQMAEIAQLVDAASLPSSVVREEVVSALLEFLEASVHQILHSRSLYSSSLFERRRLYSTVVQAARHPGLVKYIQGVIQSLKVPPGPEEAPVLEGASLADQAFSPSPGSLAGQRA